MKYVEFDETRPMDLVLLGRVAIDFNPAYNDQVKEEFKPLKKVHMFEKFVGGSPANIAVGVTRHGLKAGFFAKVSDDQFGEFVVDYFNEQGIDTSHISTINVDFPPAKSSEAPILVKILSQTDILALLAGTNEPI